MITKSGKLYTIWRAIWERDEVIAVDSDCRNAEDSKVCEIVMQDAMSMFERRKWEVMNFENRDQRTNQNLVMAEKTLA
jgi:hypothetical protein